MLNWNKIKLTENILRIVSIENELIFMPLDPNLMSISFNDSFAMSMIVSPFGKHLMSMSSFHPSLTIFGTV